MFLLLEIYCLKNNWSILLTIIYLHSIQDMQTYEIFQIKVALILLSV